MSIVFISISCCFSYKVTAERDRELSLEEHGNLLRSVGTSLQRCSVATRIILQEYCENNAGMPWEYCRNTAGMLQEYFRNIAEYWMIIAGLF